MAKFHALMLVKEKSRRLPGKNTKDFNGKPMFVWNLEKCLDMFDKVYVSSDSPKILKIAESYGAIPISRGEELCGDTPNIPVYQHALGFMRDADGIVAVHANNPNLSPKVISSVRKALEDGHDEVMTVHPWKGTGNYKEKAAKIYGSVWGISRDRLIGYGNAYQPNPDILVVDDSIEIEEEEDYTEALSTGR